MNDDQDVHKEDTQISGRSEGPFGTDDADADLRAQDNKHTDAVENSANGLDSVQVRGGQDGRNIRAVGGIDMDSQHGLLRQGDQDNSTMEVPEKALDEAAASTSGSTNTGMVDVTTSGPDDDSSSGVVRVPDAQKAAKAQDSKETEWDEKHKGQDADESQDDANEDIARTGTDLDNQPPY